MLCNINELQNQVAKLIKLLADAIKNKGQKSTTKGKELANLEANLNVGSEGTNIPKGYPRNNHPNSTVSSCSIIHLYKPYDSTILAH